MARRKKAHEPRYIVDWSTLHEIEPAVGQHQRTIRNHLLAKCETLIIVTSKPRRRSYAVTKWDRHMYPAGNAYPHRTRYYAATIIGVSPH